MSTLVPMDTEAMAQRAMGRYSRGEGSLADLIDVLMPRLDPYLARRAGGRRREIALEVMRQVHRLRGSYRPGAEVLPWVFAIARALSRDCGTPSDGRDRLHELPESLRDAWELLFVERFSVAHAAEILGTCERDVRLDAQRAAQEMFRLTLGPLEDADAPASASLSGVSTRGELGDELEQRGYRIGAEIGRGGMGIVYRGEHIHLERPRAIKMMRSHLCEDSESIDRFIEEARRVERIRHPNVVEVTDVGKIDSGRAFFVMELLDGETLAERLAREQRLSWATVKTLVSQVCEGLAFVHEREIVHRDLKPANCFITKAPDGRELVKILDFGAAELHASARRSSEVARPKRDPLGTLSYMAPELLSNPEPDYRNDVYSLGVMMFEMLTGELPFAAKNAYAIMVGHLVDPAPSLAQKAPDERITLQIEQIVARALAKPPADRFQSIVELRRAIESLDDDGDGPLLVPVTAPRSFAIPLLAAASAAVAIGTYAISATMLRSDTTRPIGEPSPAGVEAALGQRRTQLDACRTEHGYDATERGRARLVVNGESGEVVEVDLLDRHRTTELGACWVRALADLRIAASGVGRHEIEVDL